MVIQRYVLPKVTVIPPNNCGYLAPNNEPSFIHEEPRIMQIKYIINGICKYTRHKKGLWIGLTGIFRETRKLPLKPSSATAIIC